MIYYIEIFLFFFRQGRDGNIRRIDLEKNVQQNTSSIDSIYPLNMSNNSQKIASFCKMTNWDHYLATHSLTEETCVNIHSLKDLSTIQKPLFSLKPSHKTGVVMAVQPFAQNSFPNVAIGYEDSSVCIWDLRNTKEPWLMFSNLHKGPILSLDVSMSTQTLITSSTDESIHIYSVKPQQSLLHSFTLSHPGVSQVQLRKTDERIAAIACWDHKVRVFDAKKYKMLATFSYHTDVVHVVSFNYSSSQSTTSQSSHQLLSSTAWVEQPLLASGAKDGKIALFGVGFQKKTTN